MNKKIQNIVKRKPKVLKEKKPTQTQVEVNGENGIYYAHVSPVLNVSQFSVDPADTIRTIVNGFLTPLPKKH